MAVSNTPQYPSGNSPNSPNYVEQAKPVVLVSGDGGSLIQGTIDGEAWTTTTERENDVFCQYNMALDETKYNILISLTNSNFPHAIQGQTTTGRIDISQFNYSLDIPANAEGEVDLGIITRIDETNADIKYFFRIPFFNAAKTVLFQFVRGTPSQIKTDFNDSGVLQHGISNLSEVNVSDVNLSINLDSPAGAITPGLGDIIIKYNHTNGTTTFNGFVFYHSH